MNKLIEIIILGYVFNWMPGCLVMLAADAPFKKWLWLLVPFSFIYFGSKIK